WDPQSCGYRRGGADLGSLPCRAGERRQARPAIPGGRARRGGGPRGRGGGRPRRPRGAPWGGGGPAAPPRGPRAGAPPPGPRPGATVPGHQGTVRSLRSGRLRLLVFVGRIHLYEGHPVAVVVHGVRTAIAAGCQKVILTNAAGGIRAGYQVGQAVLVGDHINLT